MSEGRFLFYGYDYATYRSCIDQIRQTNRKQFTMLNTLFLIINVIYVVLASTNRFGISNRFVPFYGTYALVAGTLALMAKIFYRFSERYSALFAYLSTLLLFSYGILTSVFYPYMPAVMHHILAILIALMYIGNMANTAFLTLLGVSVFLVTSFKLKTFSIAYYDTRNAIITATLSMGLHYMFQRLRMQQFVLFLKDQKIRRELQIKSSFDGLTGLMNRSFFFSYGEEVLRLNKENYMALCLIDLDGFKEINDTLGHQMGDKVIQMTGQIILETLGLGEAMGKSQDISEWVPSDDTPLAGRLGGDEFIIILRAEHSQEEVMTVITELLSRLNAVRLPGLSDGIRASIGITELNGDFMDIDEAYRRVDNALYQSKRAGKNQITFVAYDKPQE